MKTNIKRLFFIIGSSGSGKTTAVDAIDSMKMANLIVCHSDSEKVPSVEEMIRDHGSTDEWQKNTTMKWVKKIKEEYLENNKVILDTQSRPSFIKEACEKNEILDYKIILIDCSDEERKRRLIDERKSPELANEQMMNWAKYLREKCVENNCNILDNTNLSKEETLIKLLELINN